MLCLFDLDSVLLDEGIRAREQALIVAAEATWRREIPLDAFEHLPEMRGVSDQKVVRALLVRNGGIGADEFLRKLDLWQERAVDLYRLSLAEHSKPLAAAGIRECLQELRDRGFRLALCSGCLEGIARSSLAALGLERLFEPWLGVFGSDHFDRFSLVPLARERAGSPGVPWPQMQTALVGATPRDIGAAHADDVRAIAIAAAGSDTKLLAGADALVYSLDQAVEQLVAWSDDRRTPYERVASPPHPRRF